MRDTRTYTLTKAEIQVMNILWEMPEGGCVHDIIEHYEEPKPAYTTIATFMKILLNKNLWVIGSKRGRHISIIP